jgi:hypothetical protein
MELDLSLCGKPDKDQNKGKAVFSSFKLFWLRDASVAPLEGEVNGLPRKSFFIWDSPC